MGQPKRKPRLPKRKPKPLFPLSEEELTKMAKWFVAAVGAIDHFSDFVQEAFLILWRRKAWLEKLDDPDSRKRYAARIVWNHWKRTPERITYLSDPIERPVSSDSELFYELAIGHLEEIVGERTKLVLRELVVPSEKLQRLLKETMKRKKHLGERPVVPVLSKIAEVLGFKISECITEIQEKAARGVETVGTELL